MNVSSAKLISKRAQDLYQNKKRLKLSHLERQITLIVNREMLSNLHFSNGFAPYEIVLLEAIGEICEGKKIDIIKQLTLREISSFLKNQRSEELFPSEWGEISLESVWENIYQQALAELKSNEKKLEFEFLKELKFKELSLIEKINQIKTFFHSRDLDTFREQKGTIELLDIEGETIFISLEVDPKIKPIFLDWLHLRMCEIFREPRLNIVVE